MRRVIEQRSRKAFGSMGALAAGVGCLLGLGACTRLVPLDSQDDTHDSGDRDTQSEVGDDGDSDVTGSDSADEAGEGVGSDTGTSDSDESDSTTEEGDSEDGDSTGESGDSNGNDTGDTGTGEETGETGSEDDPGSDDRTGDETDGDDTGVDTGTEPPEPCPQESHQCLAVPQGWDGPVAVGQRTWAESLPLCFGNYGQSWGELLFAGFSAPEAMCNCECGAEPTPPICEITLEKVGDCASMTVQDTWRFREGCTPVGPMPYNSSWVATVGVVQWGTCEIVNGDAVVDPPTWSSKAEVCLLTAEPFPGECAQDEQCLPRPTQAFAERICIHRVGRHACPAPFSGTDEWFLDELEDIPDDRGCSECTCSSVGADCGDSMLVHDIDSCDGLESFSWALDGECVTWSYAQSWTGASYSDADKTLGTCAPAGGEAVGEAVPQRPITVCCL